MPLLQAECMQAQWSTKRDLMMRLFIRKKDGKEIQKLWINSPKVNIFEKFRQSCDKYFLNDRRFFFALKTCILRLT